MTVDLDLPRVALKKVTPQVSAAMGGLHAAAVAAATEAGLEPALSSTTQTATPRQADAIPA